MCNVTPCIDNQGQPHGADAWRGRRGRLRDTLFTGLLLVAALAAVFPDTFFRGEVIGPGDVLYDIPPWDRHQPPGHTRGEFRLHADVVTFFSQTYSAVQKSLREGTMPTWNPYEFGGMPLLANYQSSVFYPPRLLLYALDLPWAITAFVLIKLWLCGMSAWVCGLGLRLRPQAARFFSLAWMLSGYCLLWCNWPLTDVAAWMPVLFLGVDLILRGRVKSGFATGTVGAVLLLLAGHPETAFFFSLGLGLYFLFRLVWEMRTGGAVLRPVLVCSAMWAAALLVCSAQLFPFFEYLANSASIAERAEKWAMAYPVTAAATLWAPRFFGTWPQNNFWGEHNSHLYSMLYAGIAVWVLLMLLPAVLRAPAGGAGPETALHRRRAACLIAASFVCMLLAFDAPTIGAINGLPLFSSMITCYHAVFALFSLALLAAIALDGWVAAPRRPRDFIWLPLLVLAVAALLIGIYRFNHTILRAQHYDGHVFGQILRAGLFAGLSAAVLAVQTVRRSPRLVPALLTAVLAVDLIQAQQGLNPTLPRDQFFPETELVQELQGLGRPCRIGISEGGIIAGPMAVFGVEDWVAYDGLYPARMWNFQRDLGTEFWRNMEPAAAIAYYLNDPKYPPIMPAEKRAAMECVAVRDGIEVLRNPASLPRARFVANVEIIPDRAAMVARMKAPGFDPARIALLEKAPGTPLPPAAETPPGTAEVTGYHNNRVDVRYETGAPSVLVLADAWYPDWKCRINETPAEVFPVYGVFRGVIVPAGTGTVEFFYDPASLRRGMALSWAALLACGVWGVWALRRERARAAVTL